MANPNVAAITELTMGTLAWELTADQVTHHGSSTASQSGNNSSFQMNMDCPATFTPPGAASAITLANKIAVAFPTYGNLTSSGHAATQNGDAMTELTNASFRWSNNYHRTTVWYRTNPDTGSNVPMIMAHSSQWNSALLQGSYFSNVDQSNPSE